MDDAHSVIPFGDLPPQYPPDRAATPPGDVRGASVPETTGMLRTRDTECRLPYLQPRPRPAREGGSLQPPRQLYDRLSPHGQDYGRRQHADGIREWPSVLQGGACRASSGFILRVVSVAVEQTG